MGNILYKIGYKYQVAEEFTVLTAVHPPEDVVTPLYSIDTTGLLTLRVGYAWDGPSGPAFDTKTFMRPSAIHDAFYNAMNAGLLEWAHKGDADLQMYSDCLEDGMGRMRAWWCYKSVKKYGGSSGRSAHTLMSAPKRHAISKSLERGE